MKFKFIEDGSVHSLPWTELLTMDETPFESIDDVTEGLNVMAPWYDDDSIGIQHAQAVILGQGEYAFSMHILADKEAVIICLGFTCLHELSCSVNCRKMPCAFTNCICDYKDARNPVRVEGPKSKSVR